MNDNAYWLNMWRNAQTEEFHQTETNTLLTRFWSHLNLKRHSRILVPLCGKSLDMLWLAAQGYRVIGVELSPVAVKSFFQENQLKVKKTRHGNFTCWESGNISIWCGDYFLLHELQLGRIDCVFDRASLTALPASMRDQYVEKLRILIRQDTPIFLLTIEEIAKNSELKKDHIDHELGELYREFFDIELTHVQRFDGTLLPNDDFHTDHKVYRLKQHPAA